jgi:hypothetical protein
MFPRVRDNTVRRAKKSFSRANGPAYRARKKSFYAIVGRHEEDNETNASHL